MRHMHATAGAGRTWCLRMRCYQYQYVTQYGPAAAQCVLHACRVNIVKGAPIIRTGEPNTQVRSKVAAAWRTEGAGASAAGACTRVVHV